MSGRDPRAVENELFMRCQAHSASSYPRQPWEQPGLLCVFNPVQAAFPARLSIPYQGSAVTPTNVSSATQPVPIALSSKSATPCEAWKRAVKAKRGMGSSDKRAVLVFTQVCLFCISFRMRIYWYVSSYWPKSVSVFPTCIMWLFEATDSVCNVILGVETWEFAS